MSAGCLLLLLMTPALPPAAFCECRMQAASQPATCSALPLLNTLLRLPLPCSYLPRLPAGMTEMSNMLSQDARQFAVKAKDLYHQALFRKYLPAIILVAVALFVIIMKLAF